MRWIINIYAITLSALLLPLGAVGDRWGRKPVLLIGLVLFGVARVKLRALPPSRVAVMRFSGLARDSSVARQTQALTERVHSLGLQTEGLASLARYDPPWTPWFLRRNEIVIPIKANLA